jgi:hypothetical protein
VQTNLKAFINKCSTSSMARRVSSAIVWKVIVRSYAFRLKTLSMSAIRQIFCRRKAKFSCKIGCDAPVLDLTQGRNLRTLPL